MPEKKIFIGYGTRFGATEEVAYRIAEILKEKGIESQVENLRKNKNPPSPQGFDGVIIASGMKINKWTKEPKKYIKKFRNELKDQNKIFGMYVCSVLAIQDYQEAIKLYLQKTLEENDIPDEKNRVIYDAFGGVMDFSTESKLGIFDKRALQMAAMGIEKDSEGLRFTLHHKINSYELFQIYPRI
jgi:menaquinone-dependent protoporphyrinogen IX oxidase